MKNFEDYENINKDKSLKELAIEFSNLGENCSRAILFAGATKYNLNIPSETASCCNGIRAGFGVGGVCSALVAGVMILGMIFDEDLAKQKVLLLFFNVQGELGNVNCSLVAGETNCNYVMGVIATELENIIDSF